MSQYPLLEPGDTFELKLQDMVFRVRIYEAEVRTDGTGICRLDRASRVVAVPNEPLNDDRHYPADWLHDEGFRRWLEEKRRG